MAIPFYEEFYALTGSVNGALFLQQLVYWQDKACDQELGCYKLVCEWEKEAKINYREQRKVRQVLVDLGILKTTYKRLSHRLYYKVDVQALERAIGKTLNELYGVVKKATNATKKVLSDIYKATGFSKKNSSKEVQEQEKNTAVVEAVPVASTPASIFNQGVYDLVSEEFPPKPKTVLDLVSTFDSQNLSEKEQVVRQLLSIGFTLDEIPSYLEKAGYAKA